MRVSILPALPALILAAPALAGVSNEARSLSAVEREGISLLRGLRDPAAPGPGESGASLAGLGTGTVELLIEVLEERSIPGLGDEDEPQILSVPQRETVLVAMETLGRSAVLPALDARLGFGQPEQAELQLTSAQRRTGIATLGAVARDRELSRLFELAVDPVTELHDGELNSVLSDAVRRAVTRDSGGIAKLADLARELEPGAVEAVMLGLGAAGNPNGLEFLAELDTTDERLRTLAAAQVPLLGPSPEPAWNRHLAGDLRGDLEKGSRNLRVAAAIALGELEDFSAVPDLIDLLQDDDEGLRSAAHRGLTHLVHRTSTPSAGAWRHWYRVESEWYEREAPRLFAVSRGYKEAEAVAALEEIGRHRYERHRLALEAALALTHKSAAVRRAACQAITGLGSRWAAVYLYRTLGDSDPTVATAAAEALRAVTGETRGNAVEDWDGYEFLDAQAY